MPELPEVETIRRGLADPLRGARITAVHLTPARVFQIDPSRFARRVRGQCVKELSRRGKFLVLELERDWCIFHLGMTGQLTLREPGRPDSKHFLRHPVTGLQRARQHAPDRHTHLELCFQDGRVLMFRDVRKFGRVFLLPKQDEALSRFFQKLGLEPFGKDYRLERFLEGMKPRRLAIKSLLLNQGFVAGIGNIYADEALFESGIHPARRVHHLRRFEKERLFHAIPQVLERGIRYGGTSLRDYIQSDGALGNHQEELRVYGRAGQPCLVCGTSIQRMVLSQRATHYCPSCQPRRPRSRRKGKKPITAPAPRR